MNVSTKAEVPLKSDNTLSLAARGRYALALIGSLAEQLYKSLRFKSRSVAA